MALRVTRKNKKSLRVECTTCKCAAGLSKSTIDDLLDEEIDAIELKLEDPSAGQPPAAASGGADDSSSGGISGGHRIIIDRRVIDRGETYHHLVLPPGIGRNPKLGGAITGGETSGGKKFGGALSLSGKTLSAPSKPSGGGGAKGGSSFGGRSGGGGKGRR